MFVPITTPTMMGLEATRDEILVLDLPLFMWVLLPQLSWIVGHRWELPGNHPVFAVVMVIYHYVERIWRILVTPNFLHDIYDNEKYYPGEPVNINIQSLISII